MDLGVNLLFDFYFAHLQWENTFLFSLFKIVTFLALATEHRKTFEENKKKGFHKLERTSFLLIVKQLRCKAVSLNHKYFNLFLKELEDLKIYKEILPKLGNDSHLTCIEMIMLISTGTLRAFCSQESNSVLVTSLHFEFKLSF